jgi:hypothetical protein
MRLPNEKSGLTLTKADVQLFLRNSAAPLQRLVPVLNDAHYRQANDCVGVTFTSDLPKVLNFFDGKKSLFLLHWLRKIHVLFKDDCLTIAEFTIDSHNVSDFNKLPEGLLHLKIDVTDLTLDVLKQLLNRIKHKAIFRLELCGKSMLSRENMHHFLEAFTQVELFHIDDSDNSFADELIYRNHLIRSFNISTDEDLWRNLIEKWFNLGPYRSGDYQNSTLALQKHIGSSFNEIYEDYLNALYANPTKDDDAIMNFTADGKGIANQLEYYSLINGAVVGMKETFLVKAFEHLGYFLAEKPLQYEELVLNFPLSTQQLDTLLRYLDSTLFPFSKLSLVVDLALIETPNFKCLITKLNATGLEELKLVFKVRIASLNEQSQGIHQTLAALEDLTCYRLLFGCAQNENACVNYPIEAFKDIDDRNRKKCQNLNLQKLDLPSKKDLALQDPSSLLVLTKGNLFAEGIRLKQLMIKTNREDINAYIPLDMQHIGIHEEQQQTFEVQQNQKADFEALRQDMEEAPVFTFDMKQLVDEQLFGHHPYFSLGKIGTTNDYELAKKEIFGTSLLSPKYLTHEAAIEISRNLPAYAAFNDLPGFQLKKSEEGFLVLDYSLMERQKAPTPYTPSPVKYLPTICSFSSEPSSDELRKWLTPFMFKESCEFTSDRHTSIHIPDSIKAIHTKVGDEGCLYFFNKIKEIDETHPNFSARFYTCYLKYFSSYAPLLEPSFFKALKQLITYSKPKMECLMHFIEKTGSSRSELSRVLHGFEEFWTRWTELAQGIDPNKINQAWQTPLGGNPLVYMERLLTILENARDLDEQLEALPGLELSKYGAYYASKHEYFKIVSADMQFDEQPGTRVDLPLIFKEMQAPAPKYALIYRFLGQQEFGVNFVLFKSVLEAFKEHVDNLYPIVSVSLLFLSHKRYTGTIKLDDLFIQILKTSKNSTCFAFINNALLTAYHEESRLNDAEGYALFSNLALLNDKMLSQKQQLNYCHRIIAHFKDNKANFFDLLNASRALHEKGSLLSALNIYDFFNEDKAILANFQSGLLLFSGLIAEPFVANPHLEAFLPVREFLAQAASQQKPNNQDYAFKYLLNNNNHIPYQALIAMITEISSLNKLDYKAVDGIILNHCNQIQFKTTRDHQPGEFKRFLINTILANTTCYTLPFLENSTYQDLYLFLNLHIKPQDKPRIQSLITPKLIEHEFAALTSRSSKAAHFALQINALKDFQNIGFDSLHTMQKECSTLAVLIDKLLLSKNKAGEEVMGLLVYSDLNASELQALLSFAEAIAGSNYTSTFKALLSKKATLTEDAFLLLIDNLKQLTNVGCSEEYFQQYIKLFEDTDAFKVFFDAITTLLKTDPTDYILHFCMTTKDLNQNDFTKILETTASIGEPYRQSVGHFLKNLSKNSKSDFKPFLDALLQVEDNPKKISILKLFASTETHSNASTDCLALIKALLKLPLAIIEKLAELKLLNLITLKNAVNMYQTGKYEQDELLLKIEKEPFGIPNYEEFFSTATVERIINNLVDLKNNSPFPYTYRKQLMETYLFVNEAGWTLPIYEGKPAIELSNKQIRTIFCEMKAQPFNLHNTLYILPLLRVAIYRATNKFPYPAQMIDIIHTLMQPDHHGSAIEPGQGKSLTDVMKASILWLLSDRVEHVTLSLTDVRRDLRTFGLYFDRLTIPYSKNPILSTSTEKDFQPDGINFSTPSHLSLFFSKMIAEGKAEVLGLNSKKVSLMINEVDNTLQDDQTIYRYATVNTSLPLDAGWIYTAINTFVASKEFKANKSKNEDIALLRTFLTKEAKKKDLQLAFDDKQLLTWIESSIIVQFVLKKDYDFLISDKPEQKIINGKKCMTHSLQILNKTDWRPLPGIVFGNGIQQLLYAFLNKECEYEKFAIEPETKTLFSSNAKNLVDFYRFKEGKIFASTGTPGETGKGNEIEEIFAKYGFSFSRIEPHQQRQAVIEDPQIFPNEPSQFLNIIAQLESETQAAFPCLIFFKDIDTLKRFKTALDKYPTLPSQIYTGLENEEEVIKKAATPGMITLSTSALGRNTDIPYNRKKGLIVYQTAIDNQRPDKQKNGRCSREGSPGLTHYYLNAKQMGDRDIDAFIQKKRAEANAKARAMREYNETIYDLLKLLFDAVKEIPDECFTEGHLAFYRIHWAEFSRKLEQRYHEQVSNNNYQANTFFDSTLTQFRIMVQKQLIPTATMEFDQVAAEAFLQEKAREKALYQPSHAWVSMDDCIPPEIVACKIYKPNKVQNATDPCIENKIKDALNKVFTLFDRGTASKETIKGYFKALYGFQSKAEDITKSHKHFFSIFFKNQIAKANKRSYWDRWWNESTFLNDIVSDPNYISLFKGLTDLSQGESLVPLDTLKDAVGCLFDEYLESSWFVSQDRKDEIQRLKNALQQSNNVVGLLTCLNKSRMNMLELDIKDNQSFLRWFKPVNASRKSRFQDVIDKACSLLTAVSGSKQLQPTIEALGNTFITLKYNNQVAVNQFNIEKTFDHLNQDALCLDSKDKANEAVIRTSLNRMFKVEMLYQVPETAKEARFFSTPKSFIKVENWPKNQETFDFRKL